MMTEGGANVLVELMAPRRFGRRPLLGAAGSALVAALGLAARARAAPLTAAARALSAQAGPASAAGPVQLSWVAGSTTKIEQIIGDFDNQLQQPTVNQTRTRYGVVGTDLGNSFEHNGLVYFLFGDNIGRGARDPLGYSQSTDPDGPLLLDFLSRAPGTFIPVGPPGVSMGPDEVPTAGISLNGVMYVVVKTNVTVANGVQDDSQARALLTTFDEAARSFSTVRPISQLPGGHFIKMTLRLTAQAWPGLPGSPPYVLMFGTDRYRMSNAYLAAVPAASFASGDGTRYFAGLNGTDPTWSAIETDAAPIVADPQIGDLSALPLDQLGIWIMTYEAREPRGVLLRSATQPWGPWSDPLVIFNEGRDGAWGTFIHDPRIQPDDGLEGPVIGASNAARAAQVAGGGYAPYIIERFTHLQDSNLMLHYLLSTWNPYTVVRLRSTLAITAPVTG